MPSKRDPWFVVDVEELVSEIKENLRLKAKPRRAGGPRPAPYPSDRVRPPRAPPAPEDPYEMLQQLLDTNSLVAEAVRRLREGLRPTERFFYEDDDDFGVLRPAVPFVASAPPAHSAPS